MNLIELATGSTSSELKVEMIIIAILACNVLGFDATVVLSLLLDGSNALKYGELIQAAKGSNPQPHSDAATWALAAIGVGYPIARAYVKKLKADLIREGMVPK